MSNKNRFLQFIAIIETLLLIVAGILSNKISEFFEVDKILLIVITVIVVIALIATTIYKARPPQKQKKNKRSNQSYSATNKTTSKISKRTVDKITTGIVLLPSALILSYGAMKFSQLVEQNWFIEIITGLITAVTILFASSFIDKAREQKQSTFPVYVGFVLSVIYGTAGMYLRYSPEAIKSHLLFFAIIHSVVLTVLQVVYGYYTVVYTFSKWYDKLPEK